MGRVVSTLTKREAQSLAVRKAQTTKSQVVWVLLLRSEAWNEFERGGLFYEWRNGEAVVLCFETEQTSRRFLKYHRIGGDWQPRPFALSQLTKTKTRVVADSKTPPLIAAAENFVSPITGEVFRVVPWSMRHLLDEDFVDEYAEEQKLNRQRLAEIAAQKRAKEYRDFVDEVAAFLNHYREIEEWQSRAGESHAILQHSKKTSSLSSP